MSFKALNTFIDDLFAFVVKMPTLHRVACLRDDLIFVVFLYQKWIYPVDKTRVNEFGQCFEGEGGDSLPSSGEVEPRKIEPIQGANSDTRRNSSDQLEKANEETDRAVTRHVTSFEIADEAHPMLKRRVNQFQTNENIEMTQGGSSGGGCEIAAPFFNLSDSSGVCESHLEANSGGQASDGGSANGRDIVVPKQQRRRSHSRRHQGNGGGTAVAQPPEPADIRRRTRSSKS